MNNPTEPKVTPEKNAKPFYGNSECASCSKKLGDAGFWVPTQGGEMMVCEECANAAKKVTPEGIQQCLNEDCDSNHICFKPKGHKDGCFPVVTPEGIGSDPMNMRSLCCDAPIVESNEGGWRKCIQCEQEIATPEPLGKPTEDVPFHPQLDETLGDYGNSEEAQLPPLPWEPKITHEVMTQADKSALTDTSTKVLWMATAMTLSIKLEEVMRVAALSVGKAQDEDAKPLGVFLPWRHYEDAGTAYIHDAQDMQVVEGERDAIKYIMRLVAVGKAGGESAAEAWGRAWVAGTQYVIERVRLMGIDGLLGHIATVPPYVAPKLKEGK